MTAPILTFIEMHGMNAMADILDELRDAVDLARTPEQLQRLCGNAVKEIKRLRAFKGNLIVRIREMQDSYRVSRDANEGHDEDYNQCAGAIDALYDLLKMINEETI